LLSRVPAGGEYRETPDGRQRSARRLTGRKKRQRPAGLLPRAIVLAAACLMAAGCDWLSPVTVPDPIPPATFVPASPAPLRPTATPTSTPTPSPAVTAAPRPTAAPQASGATPQASPDPLRVLSEDVTIALWHGLDPEGPAGRLLAAQVAEFEQVYPQVRVEAVFQGSPLGLHRALLGTAGTPQTPDLAIVPAGHLAEYVDAGIAAPIDGYLSDPAVGLSADSWADLIPGARAVGILPRDADSHYAMPFALQALGLWYNAGLLHEAGFASPPRTWTEMEDMALAIAASTGQIGYGYVPSGQLVEAWFLSRGMPLVSTDGTKSAFATPRGAEALAMLARLQEAGAARAYASRDESLQAFAEGRVAFLVDTTGAAQDLRRLIAGAEGSLEALGQAPLPSLAIGEAPAHTLLTADTLVLVPGDGTSETAAWLLIRYLSEPRQTASWGRMGYLPVRRSATAYLADQFATSAVLRRQVEGIAPCALPAPALRCLGEIEDYLLEALLTTRDGTAAPEDALARAASLADEALAVRCR